MDRIIDGHTKNKPGNPHRWFIGACSLGNQELLEAHSQGQLLTYSGYGVVVIDKDIDEELLFATIQSIKIKGKVICSKSVKDHYGLK